MKNNIFKSFRFEIVIYSLLSLLYTLLTEAIIYVAICLTKHLFQELWEKSSLLTGVTKSNYLMRGGNVSPSHYTSATSGIELDVFYMGPNLAVIIALAIIIGIILFITYFLLLTKRFVRYLEEITTGINELSTGNFDARIDIKNENEFTLIAGKLNKMADDIKRIMENDKKSENTKNELIASVAHDLRTPLTSIIGYLDLVSKDKSLSEEKKQKYIEVAYAKSRRLEKLIEDLFAYTKFSFGEVAMNQTEVDMVKFIDQLVDEFYPQFQEYELEYEFQSSQSSAIIMADGDLLARAFANLIGNAVKYGRDGKSIKIKLENITDQESRPNQEIKLEKVKISIINYGELIPEKDLENIFERFYRVESSRSSETGGTGLGLVIARNIILMHGGNLTVKSDFDGTVFQVTLDLMKRKKQ